MGVAEVDETAASGKLNLDAPGNTPSVPARDQREHQDEYYSKECS